MGRIQYCRKGNLKFVPAAYSILSTHCSGVTIVVMIGKRFNHAKQSLRNSYDRKGSSKQASNKRKERKQDADESLEKKWRRNQGEKNTTSEE